MTDHLSTDQIEAARRVRLIPEVQRRGVVLVRKRGKFWGLCPFHKESTPSFKVEDTFFKCFGSGCGKSGDVITFVMEYDRVPFHDAVLMLTGEADTVTTKPPTPAPSTKPKDQGGNARRALSIWHDAGELRGTPGWTYLERRGVIKGLPSTVHHALRWHPNCPWELGVLGCMVGLFTDALSGEPKAILRVAITPDGEKINRLALGSYTGCVIRLWPVATHRVVIAEGIETALSVANRYHYFAETNDIREVSPGHFPPGEALRPVWAAGGSNLSNFPVLPDVPRLIILVDHDADEAGQKAARIVAQRWHEAGRQVVRLTPHKIDQDFADLKDARHGG